MSRWTINAYYFTSEGSTPPYTIAYSTIDLTDHITSGTLTMTADETSKVVFTVPYEQGKNLHPGQALIDVKYGNDRKFFGTVLKDSYDNLTGIHTFEVTGVLGSYQFMPNYDEYGVDTIENYIATECSRFKGTATGLIYDANPWDTLYTGHTEIPTTFGDLETENLSLIPAFNIKLQKTAKSSYEFLKLITRQKNYILPSSVENKASLYWFEKGEKAYFKRRSGYNTQQVRYDDNLISFTYDSTARTTKAYGLNPVQPAASYSAGFESINYPVPFNYKRIIFAEKADKSAYTSAEMADELNRQTRSYMNMTCYAFDKHLIDESIPWFEMDKSVSLFLYIDGNIYPSAMAIAQITYDLCDSSKSKVKLGTISNDFIAGSGADNQDIQAALKDRLETSGGQMTGAITYDGGTSFDGDELKIRDRYALTCNLLDKDSMVQGGILTDSGLDYPTPNALRSPFIKVSPSTTYTYSNSLTEAGASVRYYAADKSFIGTSAGGIGVFNTPNNCYYVRCEIWYGSAVSPLMLSWAQLEKGSSASSPLPYTMDAVEVAGALRNLIPFIESGIHFSKPIKTLSSASVSVTISDLTDTDGWFAVIGDSNGAVTCKFFDFHASNLVDGGWVLPNSRDITVSISGNTLTISGYAWSTLHIISSNFVVL